MSHYFVGESAGRHAGFPLIFVIVLVPQKWNRTRTERPFSGSREQELELTTCCSKFIQNAPLCIFRSNMRTFYRYLKNLYIWFVSKVSPYAKKTFSQTRALLRSHTHAGVIFRILRGTRTEQGTGTNNSLLPENKSWAGGFNYVTSILVTPRPRWSILVTYSDGPLQRCMPAESICISSKRLLFLRLSSVGAKRLRQHLYMCCGSGEGGGRGPHREHSKRASHTRISLGWDTIAYKLLKWTIKKSYWNGPSGKLLKWTITRNY